jgi:hypothetical protein
MLKLEEQQFLGEAVCLLSEVCLTLAKKILWSFIPLGYLIYIIPYVDT